MSNLHLERREMDEGRPPLLPPRLALVASDLRTPPAHGTTAVFTVDRTSSGDMTVASLIGLLDTLDRDQEVRLAVSRDATGVRGIIIGVRPRTTAQIIDAIREAEGNEQDADEAHTAAVEYAPC